MSDTVAVPKELLEEAERALKRAQGMARDLRIANPAAGVLPRLTALLSRPAQEQGEWQPVLLPVSDEVKRFLRGIVGVVKANSYEKLSLWEEFHQRRGRPWKQGLSGHSVEIGRLANSPIFLSLFVDDVDGNRILFLDPTSRIVDWRMIEAWLEEHIPPTARWPDGCINRVDAMNFHNVLRAPHELAAAPKPSETGEQ